MFLDEGLSRKRLEALMDFYADGVGPEERRARPQGQVLHVDQGPPGLPKGGEQLPGLGRGLGHAHQLNGAAGKIIILDIDEDESGFHDMVPL